MTQAAGAVVIIGGGQAAVQAADTLRREGHDGTITIIAAEAALPYHRPPLSKACLAGPDTAPPLLKPGAFYTDKRITLLQGCRATAIDRAGRQVGLADGGVLPYDRLLIATGSRVRRLPMAEDLPVNRVQYLKTADDARRLQAVLKPGTRVGVIGAGFIGLEFAAAARKQGLEVTVLEVADRVLARVTRPEVSRHYERLHTGHGVELSLGVQLTSLFFEEDGVVIQTDAGRHLVDFLIVGIGVIPEDELAREAGLHCDQGIVVNDACRTSDPQIFAAGDCTRAPRAGHLGLWRLESVDNAVTQGTVAARAILGNDARLDGVPWFWSEQYEDKLILIGLSASHDEVLVRGDPARGAFSLCYLREGRLIAVDCVNRAADSVSARKLVAAGAALNLGKAADAAMPLRNCVVGA